MASLVTALEDEQPVEVATISNEGTVALSSYLGSNFSDAVVGTGSRRGTVLEGHCTSGGGPAWWRAELSSARYTQTMFTQIAQSVAFHRLHSIEERRAR
jgi:hypothetical protein